MRLILTLPQPHQVFQRQTLTHGVVVIEGMVDATGAESAILEARLVFPDDPEPNDTWQMLSFDPRVPRFRATLRAPAGGWHTLEVRLRSAQETIVATVAPVGVGEVFVVAGQSNAANHGETRQKPESGKVTAFDGAHWVPANDPQPGASGEGGSFIPAFGDMLARRYTVPIGVVCVGRGSTSVREWLPAGDEMAAPPTTGRHTITIGSYRWVSTGERFDALVERLHRLGPNGCRALLWHQGESDCHQPVGHNITPDEYRQYLTRLIAATRATAGWSIPWFVAQTSYHNPTDTGTPELRSAQRSLWTDGIALEGPDTDTLGPDYRDTGGKGVHFNQQGLRQHGAMWAEKVGLWLEGVLISSPS